MEHSSIERFVIPNDALQRLISDQFATEARLLAQEPAHPEEQVIDLSLESLKPKTDETAPKAIKSPVHTSWAKERSARNVDLAAGWASAETIGKLNFGIGFPDWTISGKEKNEVANDPVPPNNSEDISAIMLESTTISQNDSHTSELLESGLRMQREIISRLDQIQSRIGKLNTDQVRIDIADFSEESYVRSSTLQRTLARVGKNLDSKIGLVILLASLGGLAGGTALAISLIKLFA